MSRCTPQPQSDGFIGSMIHFVDCRSEALGSGAWQALATPGSTLAVLLTGFLTVFVALIGYNLLLGRAISVRSGTLAMIKIGVVLALATSWPAYRTLVYDIVVDGPSDIVAEIGPAAALPGAEGTLIPRLDRADRAMIDVAVLGPGAPPGQQASSDPSAAVAPPPFAGFNAFALGGSRIIFLLTVIGGLAVVRIVAGLMLALGPLFVAFLLFDNTRGLFEGWIRVLGGAALGSIGIAVTLGLELAFIEPWLTNILAQRMAGVSLPSVPTELLVVTTMFAILSVAIIVASAYLVRAFRMTTVVSWADQLGRPAQILQNSSTFSNSTSSRSSISEERSRAAAVADVLVSSQRRESVALMTANNPAARQQAAASQTTGYGGLGVTSLDRPGQRRTFSRVSASAGRRDNRP